MLGLRLSRSRALGRSFGLGTLVSLALVACVDHRPVGQLDGEAACEDILAQCEDASALGEPYESCYTTGLRGHGAACLSAHDDCVEACENASASAGGGGEGGRGEAGAASTAAGASGNPGGGGAPATGGAAEAGSAAETGGAGHTGN